jgi:3-hydroxymyristoyl/3-hydroxydecanoyl-(acyl carrier protein) dehydratase
MLYRGCCITQTITDRGNHASSTAHAWCMLPQLGKFHTGEFFFGGVERLRWRKPVVPGDVLMMRVEVKKFNKRFGVCKMDGWAYVGGDLVCEAELTLVMAKDT